MRWFKALKEAKRETDAKPFPTGTHVVMMMFFNENRWNEYLSGLLLIMITSTVSSVIINHGHTTTLAVILQKRWLTITSSLLKVRFFFCLNFCFAFIKSFHPTKIIWVTLTPHASRNTVFMQIRRNVIKKKLYKCCSSSMLNRSTNHTNTKTKQDKGNKEELFSTLS